MSIVTVGLFRESSSETEGALSLPLPIKDKLIQEWLLDHVRPRIVVSELVAPQRDCAAQYEVSLLIALVTLLYI